MSIPSDGFSSHMLQSGVWCGHEHPASQIVLSNPGNVLPFEQKIVDRSLWAEKKEQVEQLKPKNQPWAEITDFIDYSRGIINIAECLLLQNPHCCLAPLRGASFPGSLTKVTTYGKVAFDYFDYRNRNLSGRRAEIIKEMGNIIARRNTGEESFRLAVIDAAIGGHGINDLVPFIKEVWQRTPKFSSQAWELGIHLLHDRRDGTNTAKMRAAANPPNAEPGKFNISVDLHEVPKLVIEDYSAAIDFLFDKEKGLYVPCEKSGKVLLLEGEELLTIYSPNAFLLYKSFFIEGIRRAFEVHSKYRLDRIVWNRDEKD